MDNMHATPEPAEMDSRNVGIIVLDGVEDVTVRPLREPFRSQAIKKYGLPVTPPPQPEEGKPSEANPN